MIPCVKMRRHGQLYWYDTTARVTSPSVSVGRRCAGPEPGRRPVAGGQVEMQTHIEVQLSAPPIPAHLPFQIHRTVMFDQGRIQGGAAGGGRPSLRLGIRRPLSARCVIFLPTSVRGALTVLSP